MAMQTKSEAYDFALFEPKRQETAAPQKKDNIIRLPEKELGKNRRSKTKGLKFVSGFLALTVMLGLVGTIVWGQVRLTELTDGINKAAKQLDEQQNVYVQLQMKTDTQLTGPGVEEYARQNLGMKPLEDGQAEYIGISEGDKSRVVQESGGKGWLASLWEKLQQLLS